MQVLDEFLLKNLRVLNYCRADFCVLKKILEIRNSKNIRKWMYNRDLITLEEHIKFIEKLKYNNEKLYYVVFNVVNNEIVGCLNLNNLNYINKNAFLGIFANPTGNTTNKGKLLMNCLFYLSFSLLKLHTLKLEVLSTNERAIDFYKKSGFKEEGELRDFVRRDNEWVNVKIMGILNEESKINYIS